MKNKYSKYTQGVYIPASRLHELLRAHSRETQPWRIFKIMAEFVMGFEFIQKYRRGVSFFGSHTAGRNTEVYQEAYQLSYKLAKAGFPIITGGGPGVMEAANKGAFDAGGKSIGLTIRFLKRQRRNMYLHEFEEFDHFYVRKVMLSYAAQIYVYFPGGFGTLDEFFEIVTLIQTKKIGSIPVILVGDEYWGKMLDFMESMLIKNSYIEKKHLRIFQIVSNASEAYELIMRIKNAKKR